MIDTEGAQGRPYRRSAEHRYKIAAARLGISYEAYAEQIMAGNRWCTKCQQWQPVSEFMLRPERPSGYSAECFESNRRAAREYMRQRHGYATRRVP